MNGKFLILGFVALLYFGAVWFVDPFFVGILGFAALLWIGLPTVAVSLLVLLFAVGTGISRRTPLITLGVVLAFAVLVGAAAPLGHLDQVRAISTAKAYPAKVAPLLEDYRQAHCSYPASLSQLPSAPSMPRLLRRFGYRSDGKTYSFSFPVPGGFIDTCDYSSESGTWWYLST